MKLMAINEQMEMAFNNQAPQVDPVSGNEIPPGSLPEEVRDDIDARLSEGEYVVPADVVRYFGVKYFEDLRTEAKLGLAGMESDGRIGGEPMAVDPSGMPPEGMDISEEDIAALEQALTTGVANGGLMDKMARVAKYDPLVNARMNAGGLIVGFAEGGGAVQSLYNDPTRIDSLIQKVTAAAQSNPSLMGELAKRGVSVNTTQANMDPNAMQQANNQVQAFAPGGDVAPTFNAASFPLGFSTFGPSAPGMEGVTTQVAYYNPTTGENRTFAHYSSTNLPAEPIPAGFILGTAPVTSAAGVQATVDSGQNISSGGNDNDGPALPPPDKYGWAKKYDYSDLDGAYAKMMDSIDDKETALQDRLTKAFIPGLIGNAIYLDKARQINTHIAYLNKIGESEKADNLRTTLDTYIKERDVKGDIEGGNYDVDDLFVIQESGTFKLTPEQINARTQARKEREANEALKAAQAAAAQQASAGVSNTSGGGDNGSWTYTTATGSEVVADPSGSSIATITPSQQIKDKVAAEYTIDKSDLGAFGGAARGGLMKKKK